MKTLAEVAQKGESEGARVAAANALLDRGFGRPSQAVKHSGPNGGPIPIVDLTKLSGDQLDQLESIFGPLAGPGDDDAPDPGGEGQASG
ncbi:MAG TPA: hypothetical protein VGN97_12340 [Mesorhizobium sp.]|nr:hypothetical protein [Mesorhizobium sp.]